MSYTLRKDCNIIQRAEYAPSRTALVDDHGIWYEYSNTKQCLNVENMKGTKNAPSSTALVDDHRLCQNFKKKTDLKQVVRK